MTTSSDSSVKKKETRKKIIGFLLIGLIVFIALSSRGKKSEDRIKSPGSTVESTVSNDTAEEGREKNSLELIGEIVTKRTEGKAEASIWSGDNFGTPENAPYEVMVNYSLNHSITSCQTAKMLSYEIIKDLYSDPIVRKDLRRVLVSIPYYLRASMGASDGIPAGEKGTFSGHTNFWQLLGKAPFNREDETGDMASRTWGVLLDNCL